LARDVIDLPWTEMRDLRGRHSEHQPDLAGVFVDATVVKTTTIILGCTSAGTTSSCSGAELATLTFDSCRPAGEDLVRAECCAYGSWGGRRSRVPSSVKSTGAEGPGRWGT
jgi:hypothetical protein